MNEENFFIKQESPPSGWRAVWYKITAPTAYLNAEDYYYSRLLLTLLVVFILGSGMQLLAGIVLSEKAVVLAAAAVLVLNVLVYVITRRRHALLAARILIAAYFFLALLAALEDNKQSFPLLLFTLIIPLLLTSFFLSQRAILAVGAAALVMVFLAGILLGNFPSLTELFFVFAVAAFLLKANAHYQHQLNQVQQARLAFSEKYYRTLVESAQEGIWVVDAEGTTTYVNQSMADMLGYTVEEMKGTHHSKFYPEDFLEQGRQIFLQLKQGEKIYNMDRRLLHREGSVVLAMVSAQPIYDEQGVFTGLLRMVADITQRKKAEEALRQNEERFRTLVDVMAEGMIVLDERGIITRCNESAERILKLTTDQIVGTSLIEQRWQTIHKDGTPFLTEDFPGVVTLRTREPQSSVTMGFYRPDGSVVWLSINSRPLHQGGVVISFSDITYQVEIQERLQQRNEELVSVQSIAAAIAASLDPDLVLKMLARQAAGLLKAEGCVIYEIRNGEAWAVAGHGPEHWVKDELLNLEKHPLTVILNQLTKPRQILAEYTTEHLSYVLKYGIESMLLVPLYYQGQQLGSAVLIDKRSERQFSGWDVSLIQMLMHHAAIAIHNARLFKQLGESEERYRSLIELSQDAIVVQTYEYQILYANPAALRLFGVSDLEAMQHYRVLDLVAPEEHERVIETMRF
ncbi:MAG: PAS domain S-box protein, partial [Anaerolineae bacterium]|nr:PAS domain S-box protein [Anaerolineae bacterium]